tara:strand:+ start:76 stop:270 length:195 start_codon:yes stop_codon:yes gene_type:complete
VGLGVGIILEDTGIMGGFGVGKLVGFGLTVGFGIGVDVGVGIDVGMGVTVDSLDELLSVVIGLG